MPADPTVPKDSPLDAPPPIPRRAWFALALAASSYVVVLDSIGVSVAFAEIEAAFPATARTTLAWVSTGFSIALAAMLLLGGRLADRYGRRRIFLTGTGVYLVGAFISTAAPTPAVLIGSRVIQGSGGALMTATAIALALPEFPERHRGLAMGWLGAGGAMASVLGPILGSTMVDLVGWRGAFAMTIPFCALTMVFGHRLLRESEISAHPGRLDLPSVGVGIASVALFTLAIIQGRTWGWGSAPTLGSFAISIGLFPVFVHRSATTDTPLLSLSVFANRRFTVATIAQLGTQTGIFAWFFATPLFLQNIWGWSPVEAGWALALAMMLGFISIPAGRWADRRGYRSVLALGALIPALGMGWWIIALDGQSDLGVGLVPGLVLFGAGAGIVGVPGTGAALVGVSNTDLGMANAAHQTTRRTVQALGVAAAVAILGSRDNDSVASFKWVWALTLLGYLFSALVIAVAYPADREPHDATARPRGL